MAVLTCETVFCDGENILFFSRELNGLFCIGKKTQKMSYIGSIRNDCTNGKLLFTELANAGEIIIFAPRESEVVALYDMEKKVFDEIPLIDEIKKKQSKFLNVTVIDDCAYFVGWRIPYIAKLNISTHEIYYRVIDELKNGYENAVQNDELGLLNQYVSSKCAVKNDVNNIFIACAFANTVIEVSPDLNVVNSYMVGDRKGLGFSGICYDGQNYWLFPLVGNILIRWSVNNGNTTEVTLPELNGLNTYGYFSYLQWKKFIFALPIGKNPLCIVNTDTLDILKVEVNDIFEDDIKHSDYPISVGCAFDENSVLLGLDNGEWRVLCLKNERFEIKKFVIDGIEDSMIDCLKSQLDTSKSQSLLFQENEIIDFNGFLKIIS